MAGLLRSTFPRPPASLESVGSKGREGHLPVCLSELCAAEKDRGPLEEGQMHKCS